MELIQVGKNTYYLQNPTNIGIYKINDHDVYIIDSGNDKEAGRKILRMITEQGWNIVGIIHTHSNADHIGGAKFIQDRTNCTIYSTPLENAFTMFPILESSLLYGGYPIKDLRNKFLMAKAPNEVQDLTNLPSNFEIIPLPGHYLDMVGIKTDDDVYFLGDSLFNENTIAKYHIFFIYDVKGYLDTLDYLETLQGTWFIPSHVEATQDIHTIIASNRKKIYEICDYLLEVCNEPSGFEVILKNVFDHFELKMNAEQYVLIGSTIRSYLSYLYDENKVRINYVHNEMIWEKAVFK